MLAKILAIFIILVGAFLGTCRNNILLEKELGDILWTRIRALKFLYAIINLIGGLVFVGYMLYLTFAEHWWFLLVSFGLIFVSYIVNVIIDKLISPLYDIVPISLEEITFGYDASSLFVRRVVGTVFVIIGITMFCLL